MHQQDELVSRNVTGWSSVELTRDVQQQQDELVSRNVTERSSVDFSGSGLF